MKLWIDAQLYLERRHARDPKGTIANALVLLREGDPFVEITDAA